MTNGRWNTAMVGSDVELEFTNRYREVAMFRIERIFVGLASAIALLLANSVAGAQPPRTATRPAQPQANGPYRQLAPGVEKTISPERQEEESFSRHDVVELLKVDPGFDWAKDIRYTHPIWDLEFTFKPMRMIEVDVPEPSGRLQRKLVWYLVYRVKNMGPDPVEFRPWFVLETLDGKKRYPDRLVPVAVPTIQRREDPRRKLLNSVEIATSIPSSADGVDRSVWGVVTWEDIDPRVDHFAVFISGLSSAYRWSDDTEKEKRDFVHKTLKLNFWRPGDQFHEHEAEIRRGTPDGKVDYEWVYR
jgi:hypothetical protein